MEKVPTAAWTPVRPSPRTGTGVAEPTPASPAKPANPASPVDAAARSVASDAERSADGRPTEAGTGEHTDVVIDLDPVVDHMTRLLDGYLDGSDGSGGVAGRDRRAADRRHNPVAAAVGHSLRGRGKMVRAEILLATCAAVGGDPDSLTVAAAGIEYGHLASLVHDDLIDRDTLRRNEPTVWHHFGPPHAVVTGDWLLFAAFHLLARCGDRVPAERVVRALRALSQSGLDSCFGASYELTLAGDVRVPVEDYLQMARAKTGSVLRGAAVSGAVLGGGGAEQAAAAGGYGEHLGIAFQIVDDLLPYTTDEATLGKPVLSDVRNRRPTLPVLYALEDCAEDERELLRATYADPPQPGEGATDGNAGPACDTGVTPDPSDVGAAHERLRQILTRTGALARTRGVAEHYQAASLAALAALPAGAGRERLREIAAAVLDRDR